MTVAMMVFGLAWSLILYTYIGFPLLLTVFARIFGSTATGSAANSAPGPADRQEPEGAALPRVAMIVAAFNEEAVLEAKLANTWDIDYPADRFQVWIGSDGSSDRTDAILSSCDDPRLVYRPFAQRRGKISVLNDLFAEVDADLIVMSDANTIYAPDAVRRLISHFSDPRVGCVSGELSLTRGGGVSGEGLYWRYEGWIKRNESRLGFLIGCNGGIFALRRQCFEPLPPSTIVEDFVMTVRILERGWRVLLDPEARAFEPPCGSSRAEMIRKIRIGAGGFQALGLTGSLLLPRHGLAAFAYWGHKVLRWLVPIFFLAGIMANAVLCSHPMFRAMMAVQLSGALVALAAYDERIGPLLPRWTRPISYFYLMNYSLFCGLIRFLGKTQRVTWDTAAKAGSGPPASDRSPASISD